MDFSLTIVLQLRGSCNLSGFPLFRLQKSDLVVHDRAQAHDADVDVVFLADQSGVFQRPPAWQCVAAKR